MSATELVALSHTSQPSKAKASSLVLTHLPKIYLYTNAIYLAENSSIAACIGKYTWFVDLHAVPTERS
jgi:hypothetical protein